MIETCLGCLVVVLAVTAALTAVLARHLRSGEDVVGDWLVSLCTSIVLTGALGVVLVRFNAFASVPVAAGGAGLLFLVEGLFRLLPSGSAALERRPPARPDFRAIALLGLALALFLPFPTYFLSGARDHGVHIIQAIVIARTGGLNLDLTVPTSVLLALDEVAHLDFPGFYNNFSRGLSADPSSITAQGRPFSPVMMALGSWAGGLEGIVRTGGVVSSLCVAMVYVVARRYMSAGWAALAAVALLANASFLWTGRATFSEPATVLINLTVLALLVRGGSRPSAAIAVLAGAIAGIAVLNRWDGVLTGFFLAGALVHSAIWNPGRLAFARVAMLAFVVVAGAGYLDGAAFGRLQWMDLKDEIRTLLGILGLLALAGAAVPPCVRYLERTGWAVADLALRVVTALAAGVAVWILVRIATGSDGEASPAARTVIEMAWYLTYPVIALLPAALLLGQKRPKPAMEFVFVVGLAANALFVAFTLDSRISPDHFWASRRWLAYCIPLSVLCAAFALSKIAELGGASRRPAAAAILTAAIAALYGLENYRLASSFLFESQHKDLPAGLDRLAETLSRPGAERIVLVEGQEGHHISPVLTYVYGIPTLNLKPGAEAPVPGDGPGDYVLIGHFPDAAEPLGSVTFVPLCARRTEQAQGRRPASQLIRTCKRIRIHDPASPTFNPPVEPSRVVEISGLPDTNDPDILGVGWRQIESWGAWMEGPLGTLSLRVPPGTSGRCRLRLVGDLFLHENHPAFSMRAAIDGQVAAAFEARLPARTFDWSIPVGAGGEGGRDVTIELSVDRPRSPAELGLSTDRRRLSIGLRSFQLAGCGA